VSVHRGNVETVQRGIALFNSGDLDSLLALLHPDIELTPGIGPLLGVATIRGKEAVRRFWEIEMPEALADFRIEPVSVEAVGDAVLVEARYSARGPGSGVNIEQTFTTIYTFRDELVETIYDHTTRAEAMAAIA
jgi:ketosteroid isomerase-like protein